MPSPYWDAKLMISFVDHPVIRNETSPTQKQEAVEELMRNSNV